MRERDAMERFERETDPPEEVVERVRDEILEDEAFARVHLGLLPQVPPEAVGRVRAALLERQREQGTAPDWRWALVPVGVAAAAAAFVVSTPEPASPVAPAPLAATLVSDGAEDVLQPTEDVHLSFHGTGTLSGTDAAPRLAWESGSVEIAVTPDQQIDLRVQTREAEVRVLGTVFEVSRDARGTRVSVTEGKVSVSCDEGEDRVILAGERAECAPTTAAGLLGRARSLESQGSHDQMLIAAEAGLARAEPGSAIAAELMVARIGGLVALGSRNEALAQTQHYLILYPSGPRANELNRTAAALSLQDGDCAAAWPHLDALPARTAAEQAWLESCPPE